MKPYERGNGRQGKSSHTVPIIKQNNLSFLEATVNRKPCKVLVDIGANCSIINDNLVPTNAKRIHINSTIAGISGNSITVRQIAFIRFRIGGKFYCHPFRIANTKFQYAILGTDFLNLHKANISLGDNTISLQRLGYSPKW